MPDRRLEPGPDVLVAEISPDHVGRVETGQQSDRAQIVRSDAPVETFSLGKPGLTQRPFETR